LHTFPYQTGFSGGFASGAIAALLSEQVCILLVSFWEKRSSVPLSFWK